MWESDLLEPASVQYGDWKGTVAGDDVDMRDVCEFFGIDPSEHRVLAVDVTIYGGNQVLTAYGVAADQGWDELPTHHEIPIALTTRSISLIPTKGAISPPTP